MNKILFTIMILTVCVGPGYAEGVPALINYQGEIQDDSGTPLGTAFYNVDFRLYDTASAAEGGTLLWSRRYNLYVMNGQFNVILGQGGSVVSGDSPVHTNIMDVFSSYNGDPGYPRYLSLALAGEDEFTPRQQLLSAPYAVRAAKADYADETLHATTADNATHATSADSADNATLADNATRASNADSADRLGGQLPTYYARADQLPTNPTGSWQVVFWGSTNGHLAPIYWDTHTFGIGGDPGGGDEHIGLSMVAGNLQLKNGSENAAGMRFPSEAAVGNIWHSLQQFESGGNVYCRLQGYADAGSESKQFTQIAAPGHVQIDAPDTQVNGPLSVNGTLTASSVELMDPSMNFLGTIARNNNMQMTADYDGFLLIRGICTGGDVAMSMHYHNANVYVNGFKARWYPYQSWTFPVAKGETVTISCESPTASSGTLEVHWMHMGK